MAEPAAPTEVRPVDEIIPVEPPPPAEMKAPQSELQQTLQAGQILRMKLELATPAADAGFPEYGQTFLEVAKAKGDIPKVIDTMADKLVEGAKEDPKAIATSLDLKMEAMNMRIADVGNNEDLRDPIVKARVEAQANDLVGQSNALMVDRTGLSQKHPEVATNQLEQLGKYFGVSDEMIGKRMVLAGMRSLYAESVTDKTVREQLLTNMRNSSMEEDQKNMNEKFIKHERNQALITKHGKTGAMAVGGIGALLGMAAYMASQREKKR